MTDNHIDRHIDNHIDRHIDRLVRRVDPYDVDAVNDLRGTDQALLEEIMAQQPVKRLEPRRRRRSLIAAVGLAAASALALALAAPMVLSDHDDGAGMAGPTHDKGQIVHTDGGQTDSIVYASATIKAAKQNPRLLIGEPGWKVTTVYGFAKDKGTIVFTKGGRVLEMNWYPADSYDAYYADRLDVSEPESITIDGQQGSLFRYSANDFAVMLQPDGSSFAELRTGAGWKDKAAALAVFAKVKKVDVQTWLAAMPPEIVIPGEGNAVADEILSDMTLPPGFDRSGFADLGTSSRYHFGAQIAQDVVCGWLYEWKRADRADDRAAVQRAVDALRSTRNWDILDEMAAVGDFSEGVWMVADGAAPGKDPMHFMEALGCHRDAR